VSIEDALLWSHEYRAVADASPLVNAGIFRLLLAIAQDILHPSSEQQLRKLWQAESFPDDLLQEFKRTYRHRFDLFSDEFPFLQSRDLPVNPVKKSELKSVANLLPDWPSGTEVTHYRHQLEDQVTISFASAAAALVTLPAFAASGGKGMRPALAGGPPFYVFPGDDNLFRRIINGLLLPEYQPSTTAGMKDTPPWRSNNLVVPDQIVNSIGYLEGLLFRIRAIRLIPTKVNGFCTITGEPIEWGVKQMVFLKGEQYGSKEMPQQWLDPFVSFLLPEATKKSSKAKKTLVPPKQVNAKRSLPSSVKPAAGKMAWREFAQLFFQVDPVDNRRSTIPPRFISQTINYRLGGNHLIRSYSCVGMRVDKAKKFEWIESEFLIPDALLEDKRLQLVVIESIAFASQCASFIASLFRSALGHPTKKSERHTRLKEEMLDTYWIILADAFHTFIAAIGNQDGPNSLASDWRKTVVNTAIEQFQAASRETGEDGSSLRAIVQANQRCRRNLMFRLQESKL
jgi:CRISPR system Cascade subunit CasA